MKRFLAIAVLMNAASAFAASDRAIYDIMYLPKSGTTYGMTETGYLKREVQRSGGNSDIDISGWGLEQTIGHSLTDRLSVELNMNYVNGEIDPDGGSSVDQSGLSDPTATGRFRLIDEVIRLDLVGGVMLNLGESEFKLDSAGRIESLDNRQGGNAVFAGLQVGEKSENLQWAVFGGFRRNFEREYDVEDTEGKMKGNNEVQTRLDLLNKLAEVSFLRSHLEVNFTEAVKAKTDGFEVLEDAPVTTYEIGTEYQHLISQDLLARVGVNYEMENADSGSTDSDRAWTFLVGANYQF